MRSACRFSFFSFMLLCLAAQAQQKTNPHTQIAWPANCSGPHMVYNYVSNQCVVTPDMSGVTPGPPAICANGSGGALTATGCTLSAPQVVFPPSCSSGVYSPATNACVPTGTAANPGGSAGQTQINFGGGTFSGIPGSVSDPTYGWKTQGGLQYAKGWQSGAGNNGIANCFSGGNVCVADPSYAFTELPVPYSFPNSPSYYQDLRNSQQTNVFRNPQVSALNFSFGQYPLNGTAGAAGTMSGVSNYCYYDNVNAIKPYCQIVGQQVNLPGYSLGFPTGFTGVAGGWYTDEALSINHYSRNAGISAGLSIIGIKTGIGDNQATYEYHHCRGGRTAIADESCTAHGINTFEDPDYTSTCSSGCTPGSGSIKAALGNAGNQGVGQYLTDTTQASITGNMTAIAAGLGGGSAITVDATVAASNAWGTVATVNTPNNGVPPFTSTMSVAVTVTSGSFVAGTLVCFTGSYHEQAIPSSVTGTAPNQTLTFSTASASGLRRPHTGGSYAIQGGVCGTGIEATYITATGGTRYVFDCPGSTDTHTLQCGQFQTSAYGPVPIPAQLVQSINLTSATASSGPVVSAVLAGGGSVFHPYNYVGVSWLLSGSSDSALNATCTNAQWTDATHFNCTIAGLSGVHTTTGAMSATLGIGQFNLRAIAETLDVQDYNEAVCDPTSNPAGPHAPCVDGTFALEPNVIQFATNDAIEQLNHPSTNFKAISAGLTTKNPYQLLTGLGILISGYGNQGGTNNVGSNSFLNLTSQGLTNQFANAGGVFNPPNIINVQGSFYEGFNMAGPAAEQAVLYVTPTSAQMANQNYSYYLLGSNTPSTPLIQIKPVTNEMLLFGNVVMISPLGTTTFADNITFAKPAAPTPVLTQSAVGGTLAAGSYCYRVAIRNNASGGAPGIPGTEACIAVASGTTNTVTVKVPHVNGVTFFYIYGRTTGAELLMPSGVLNSGLTHVFVDDGTTTPAGAMGTVDFPAGFVGAQLGSFNSQGTAFNTTVKAAAGNTTNYTNTLPPATGTLGLGLTIPTGTPTLTAGTNVTSCTCAASYTCTNTRGRLTIVGGTATTGTICTVNFSASLSAAPFFTLGEMGATTLHGIDHGVPGVAQVLITAAVSVSGATINVDYETQP